LKKHLSPNEWMLQVLKYFSLIGAALVILIPPYVIIVNAFKGSEEYIASGKFAFPHSFLNFDNFLKVIDLGHLGLAFYNTGFIIFFSLLANVLLGTMVSYSLGRFDFRLKPIIFGGYIAATFIPQITTQIATFGVIHSLGLFNTKGAAILLYSGTDVVQIYLYLQFIRNIPYALDESAMIEGASLLKIYRSIIFPLLAPATATVIILKTISIYNDLFTPYLYMPAQQLAVVSTMLFKFAGPRSSHWELICAAIIFILIPTALLYLFLQRYIFSGIVSGSVKE
jgi:raffinose/stachyose/melibiose transport system permease protein